MKGIIKTLPSQRNPRLKTHVTTENWIQPAVVPCYNLIIQFNPIVHGHKPALTKDVKMVKTASVKRATC